MSAQRTCGSAATRPTSRVVAGRPAVRERRRGMRTALRLAVVRLAGVGTARTVGTSSSAAIAGAVTHRPTGPPPHRPVPRGRTVADAPWPATVPQPSLPPRPGTTKAARTPRPAPLRSLRTKVRSNRTKVRPSVREGGLEPPRPFGHQHLKLARLPFRHSRKWIPNVSAPCNAWHAPTRPMSERTRYGRLAHRCGLRASTDERTDQIPALGSSLRAVGHDR